MKELGRHHPIDPAYMCRMLDALKQSYGAHAWDITLRPRGLLVTMVERRKLAGHIGTIPADYTHGDVYAIVQTAMLRDRGRVARLARPVLPERAPEAAA